MIINEIFHSIQGEGRLAGVSGVFIRLAGCPLRCKWCDTAYAFDEDAGEDMTVTRIVNAIADYPTHNVIITGGEPLAHSDMSPRNEIKPLLTELKKLNSHITIETSGVVFIPDLPCDLMSVSPKTSNAGKSAINLDVLQKLIDSYDHQLKFVIVDEQDITEVAEILKKLNNVDRSKVMLMPQASNRETYLAKAPVIAELCIKHGFTFCPRLHVLLWDNQRGK